MDKVNKNCEANYNKPFSKRLRELLNNANDCSPLKKTVYQHELAKAIGVTRQSINAYTLGTSYPRLDDAIKIADFFNVTIDYLTGKADCATPDNEEISKRTGLSDKSIETLELNNRFDKNSRYSFINLINFLIEERYQLEKNTEIEDDSISIKGMEIFSLLSSDINSESYAFITLIQNYLAFDVNEKILCIERNGKKMYVLDNINDIVEAAPKVIPLDELIKGYCATGIINKLTKLREYFVYTNGVDKDNGNDPEA